MLSEAERIVLDQLLSRCASMNELIEKHGVGSYFARHSGNMPLPICVYHKIPLYDIDQVLVLYRRHFHNWRPWTTSEVILLQKLHAEGMGWPQISSIMNRTMNSCRNKLRACALISQKADN